MQEHGIERDCNSDKMPYVRTGIGLIVLIAGLVLAFTVVQQAFNIINGKGTFGILENTFSPVEVERTIKTATDHIQLPEAVFPIIGYLLIALLLSICAGIASTIIKSGANIIRPDYDEIIRRLKKRERKDSKST